ncbi:MAG TPA: ABC transporter permease [Acidimicrobiales bacterium]|nr:ABC transporter permease [Acidimicrobiales bacterium]
MASTIEGFDLTPTPPPVRGIVRDVWRSRGLIAVLARKDFFVRYRRTSFGLLWAVGLPLLQAMILTLVFGHLLRSHAPDYAAYVFAGMVPWSYFSSTLGGGATAIVDNSSLSNRIYFPRAVLPLVSAVSAMYSVAVSVAILVVMCLGFGVHLGPKLLLLIPGVVLVAVLASAFSLVLAALHVYFRDVRFLVTAALTVWLYVTPIIFSIDQLPRSLRPFVRVNPMTGVVELFRFATVGASSNWTLSLLVTGAWIVALVVLALVLHRRFDRLFADRL